MNAVIFKLVLIVVILFDGLGKELIRILPRSLKKSDNIEPCIKSVHLVVLLIGVSIERHALYSGYVSLGTASASIAVAAENVMVFVLTSRKNTAFSSRSRLMFVTVVK